MSNLVYGDIPRANIELYEAAGATFNATTGYFELNGLTDISYEEMAAIYKYATTYYHSLENRFREAPIRTNLPEAWEGKVNPNNMYANASVTTMFYLSKVEVAHVFPPKDGTIGYFAPTTLIDFVRYTSYIKTIDGVIDVTSRTTIPASFLHSAFSLENVQLFGLKANLTIPSSPRLSTASVAYMINNEAATSAITITLHATAYARCQADTTEYTYSGQTYTGIIAYATAKNITIASA